MAAPRTPNAEIHIRTCSDEDLGAVAGLYRQWEAEGITWGLTAETAADLRANLGPFFLVAERGGEIVGFVAGRLRHAGAGPPDNLAVFPVGAEYLEIEDVYVAPDARRAGIGSRLVQRVLGEARERGVDRSTVFSSTRDTAAITRFYERLGYRAWGVQFFK
jgi:ribosomal protein S18 acetylase RimI-like enzyme